MRRQQLIDGVLAMAAFVAFFMSLFGASAIINENTKGWILEAVAFVIAVPVVILANREEKE